MSKKKIVIEFDEEGNPTLDGEGFVGPECSKFLSEIQQALGAVTTRKQKPEYAQRRAGARSKNVQRR